MNSIKWVILQLADAYANSRGSATCRLRGADGCDVVYMSSADGGLVAPFGMSSFDESTGITRVSLDIRLDCVHTLAYFDAVDEWAVSYKVSNSERLFGRPLSLQQVKASYHPCVTREGSYAPFLKTKFSTEPGASHFWDECPTYGS